MGIESVAANTASQAASNSASSAASKSIPASGGGISNFGGKILNNPMSGGVGDGNPLNSLNKNNANNSSNDNQDESSDNPDNETNQHDNNKKDKKDNSNNQDQSGQDEKSGTHKTLEAAGRAAAAYFSGGESVGADQAVLNNRHVQGVIENTANTIDKVPGVEALTDELNESGAVDGVNDTLDAAASLKNGDIKGTIKSAKSAVDDIKKLAKFVIKKYIIGICISIVIFFLLIFVVIFCVNTWVGAVSELVDTVTSLGHGLGNAVMEYISQKYSSEYFQTTLSDEEIEEVAHELIHNFDDLSDKEKTSIRLALKLVGGKYKWNGKPSGPGVGGIPAGGLDCSGAVEWHIWSGTGEKPMDENGNFNTESMEKLIGTVFDKISEDELRPGDYGLIRYFDQKDNKWKGHTGIYIGDGQWVHAAREEIGVVIAPNPGLDTFLRLKET